MTTHGAAVVMRSPLIATWPLTSAVAAGGVDAIPSPGCDAVNAKAFDHQIDNQIDNKLDKTVSGFSVGDSFSIRMRCWTDPLCRQGVLEAKLIAGDGSTVYKGEFSPVSKGDPTVYYQVTGRNQDTTLTFSLIVRYTIAFSYGKCLPPA